MRKYPPSSMFFSLTFLLVAAFMMLLPMNAEAQHYYCHDCRVVYYEFEDCYINSCAFTLEHGAWNNCSQQGECGDEECTPYGGMCTPYVTWREGLLPSPTANPGLPAMVVRADQTWPLPLSVRCIRMTTFRVIAEENGASVTGFSRGLR